jgi:hypothetical protein
MLGNPPFRLKASGVEDALSAQLAGECRRRAGETLGEIGAEADVPTQIKAVDCFRDSASSFAFRLVRIESLAAGLNAVPRQPRIGGTLPISGHAPCGRRAARAGSAQPLRVLKA